jgi:aspartate/tyrosine/aromatic aminotransferase
MFFYFRHSGLDVQHYKYYDPKTIGFDFNGAVSDMNVSMVNFAKNCIVFERIVDLRYGKKW